MYLEHLGWSENFRDFDEHLEVPPLPPSSTRLLNLSPLWLDAVGLTCGPSLVTFSSHQDKADCQSRWEF